MSELHPDPGSVAALLTRQTTWLQRLCRELIHDPALAEDAAQDALLSALQRPPVGIEDERSLRAWLRRVVQRAVASTRRRDRARTTREARTARPEAGEEADPIVRAAIAHELAGLVLELPEPARRTMLLRYQDSLSTPEIAARLGESPAAVRKRLSRTLASLRARMDNEHEGRRALWALPLARWSREEAAALPVAASLAAAGLAAAAGVGLFALARTGGGADGPAPARPAQDELALAAATSAPTDRATVVDDLSLVGSAPSSGRLLRGSVRSASGAPLPGVPVLLNWAWDDVPPFEVISGADGTFELTLTEPMPISPHSPFAHDLFAYADADGHLPARWAEDSVRFDEHDPLQADLVLEPGTGLRGRLTDAAGRPVDRAQVLLVTDANDVLERARSAVDGFFELALGEVGAVEDVRIAALSEEAGFLLTDPLTLEAERDRDVGTLAFDVAGMLEGVLVDAYGDPVADQRISVVVEQADASPELLERARSRDLATRLAAWRALGAAARASQRTDAAGHFRLEGLLPGAYVFDGTLRPTVRGDDDRLHTGVPAVLELGPTLALEAVDAEGLPVVGTIVTLASPAAPATVSDGSGGASLLLDAMLSGEHASETTRELETLRRRLADTGARASLAPPDDLSAGGGGTSLTELPLGSARAARRLPVAPGTHHLLFEALGAPPVALSVEVSADVAPPPVRVSLEFEERGRVEVRVSAPEDDAVTSGRVRALASVPPAFELDRDGYVVRTGGSTERIEDDLTASRTAPVRDGVVSLELAPGRWTLQFLADTGPGVALLDGDEVVVDVASRSDQEVELVVPLGARLRLLPENLAHFDPDAPPYVFVELHGPPLPPHGLRLVPGPLHVGDGEPVLRNTFSLTEPMLTLRSLEPGSFDLVVDGPDLQRVELPVVLAPGETTEVSVPLLSR